MKYEKTLLLSKSKLNKNDSLNATFGCRHTNPDICSNNGIPEICAFTSKDCICKRPPRSWKKIYDQLKENELTQK